ncbi:MAG: tail fiber domain-containing protein, partial [Haloarculaceae archaeon]
SSTNNVAYDNYCTIGGGGNNEAGSSDTSHSAHYATVCGGEGNAAYDDHSAVVGGKNNTAGVDNSTDSGETGGFVGAGYGNTASGFEAMIPGGKSNTADGDRSFAAGRQASADHNGAFVWGDSSSTSVSSSATDEVRFQATGGLVVENTSTVKVTAGLAGGTANDVHIDSSTGQLYDASASSARYKTNIEPLAADTESVLELEPRSFEYKETEQESVGFVAEEADETFPEIVVYDEEGRPDGIQYSRLGVYLLPEVRRNRTDTEQLQARVRDQRDRIDELEAELDRKAERVDKLEAELESRGERVDELERDLDAKDERIARLEERLDAVEAALD